MGEGSWDELRARVLSERVRGILETWHAGEGTRDADRIVDRQTRLVFLLASGRPARAEDLGVSRAALSGDLAALVRILGPHRGALGLE